MPFVIVIESMEQISPNTPPQWKRPEDVMKLHKLKMRKRTVQSRVLNTSPKIDKEQKIKHNRSKNPFRLGNDEVNNAKRARLNEIINETSVDGTLFRLMNFSQDLENQSQSKSQDNTFTNLLDRISTHPTTLQPDNKSESKSSEELPADWTLRVKIRLISSTPFPWQQNLKTREEAASITGFVRCINDPCDTSNVEDASLNSKFRESCFVWQHPSIPWLELYPRLGTKSSSNTVSIIPPKDVMYKDWVQSFSSLFQLLKAKHCPYFYFISNNFVCLFRCAGMGGYSDVNAMVTPTTRGFRQLLKDEHVQFSMPLSDSAEKISAKHTNSSSSQQTDKKSVIMCNDDTGYDSLDVVNQLNNDTEDESDNPVVLTDEEEETESWLKSMGVEESEIKKLNSSQLDFDMNRERQIDKKPQSLVLVEGIETQSLFNFLINCKSLIPTTGQFAGIPPTLLAPVAFVGSTLKSLTVRESVIKLKDKRYHSIEIKGPILPHTIYGLCDLMKNTSINKFTFTFGNLEASKSFSSVPCQQNRETYNFSPITTPTTTTTNGSWLQRQNLLHCGLPASVLSNFCSRDTKHFDSIKFCDNCFTCL